MRTTIKQILTIAIAGLAFQSGPAAAQDKFQKLSGAEIRAKFTGMQFTDEVHWAETYGPGGKLTVEEMGAKRVGTWRVEKDQLCTQYGKDGEGGCLEVWMSGRKVELRTPGSTGSSLEGVLERPSSRR